MNAPSEPIYQIKTDKEHGHKFAENMNGEYIGSPDFAKTLLQKYDIRPEAIPGHNGCSIGFSPRDQKWYGWSHRALYGFEIGSETVKGDCAYVGATPEDLIEARVAFWEDMGEDRAKQARDECQILEDRSGIRILHAPLMIPMVQSIDDIIDEDGEIDIEDSGAQLVDINADAVSIEKCGRGEWKAKTMEDAKQMAIDFANGVS